MRSRRRGKDDQPTEKEEDDDVATWWWVASKTQIERMARIKEKRIWMLPLMEENTKK